MSFKITIGSFLLATGLLVAGCDAVIYNTPSEITAARTELRRENVNMTVDTASLSPALVQKMAQDYRNKGDSPMMVSITFDPASSNNTARKASDRAAQLAKALSAQGVKDLRVDTLPVNAAGDESQTIVTYDALIAVAPPSCEGDVLAMDMTTDLAKMEKHKLGCSVETYVARQIARPADLAGTSGMDNAPGRYHVNSLEPYMSGAPNPALSGENASGI